MNDPPARNAEAAPQPPQEEEIETMQEPRKQHGDALLDGSGTRHGVTDAQARPNL